MSKHQKSISAPKTFPIERKGSPWTIKPIPGPHSEEESVPITIVLRDVLGYADTVKEVKKLLHQGKCLVDGREVKDYRFPLGAFDVLKLGDLHYRVVPSAKGFDLIEIDEKEAGKKLCRVEDKKVIKGGKVQLNLNDGKNIEDGEDIDTGSSVLLDVDGMEIEDTIEMEEGCRVMIVRGKNRGKIGKLKEMKPVKGSKPNRVVVEWEGNEIDLPEDLIFPVGEENGTINLGE